jgi:hypothetical protein
MYLSLIISRAGGVTPHPPIFPEPVFVNLLRSPEIDSQPGGPVRQPYLSYRPAMLHRLAESNPRNRFLVSLKVYKYGLSWSVDILFKDDVTVVILRCFSFMSEALIAHLYSGATTFFQIAFFPAYQNCFCCYYCTLPENIHPTKSTVSTWRVFVHICCNDEE